MLGTRYRLHRIRGSSCSADPGMGRSWRSGPPHNFCSTKDAAKFFYDCRARMSSLAGYRPPFLAAHSK